jgi:hypothetical protein
MGPMFPGIGILWMLLLPVAAGLVGFALIVTARMVRTALERTRSRRGRGVGKHSIEYQILRVAARRGGVLTVTDLVMETGLAIEQAEKALDRMVDGKRVSMNVSDAGVVTYEFIELAARKDTGE